MHKRLFRRVATYAHETRLRTNPGVSVDLPGDKSYNFCMASKVTSEPLFGSATPQDVEAIKNHMAKFAARTSKDGVRARALLETIGAIKAEPQDPGDTGPVEADGTARRTKRRT